MTRQTATQTNQQTPSTSSLSRGGILQRKCESCGNHTIAGGECTDCAKKGSVLQRKLAIGSSNDPLEREADRVADQVMAAPAHPAVSGSPPRIQRFTGQSTGQADMAAPASVDHVLSRPGRPLEPSLQQDMGHRFGHDFSRVRVHTDAAAERSAREVNANAYTVGHDIVFGADRYGPGTQEGRRLIAHELTHVVQQSGSDRIHVGQGGEKCSLSTITPKAPHHRESSDAGERAAGTDPVIATSQFTLRSAPNAPMLQLQLAPDAEPAKTGSRGVAMVEGIASKLEGTKTEDRSTAADAGKGAPFLGLSPEKVQAAAKEVVARVEGAAARGKAEAEQATKLIQWGTLKIPIDESLLKSKNVNYELAIRYFQAVLKRVGVELEYWMAERIHARLAWKDLSTEEHTRQVVSDQLAAKDNTIGYTSNKDSAPTVVNAYYDILKEDQERLRRNYEELHKVHYAEDAILSFYIAHVNGVISVVNGILDLPVAPVNLVQSVRGKEHYRFLGRIPKIDYVGDYGKKYGGAMETGVVLGLILVPGAQGGAGPVLSSAEGGAALAEGAGGAIPFLTRLLGGAKVAAPVIKFVKWLLGVVAGVSVGGQAVVDTAKAIKALQTGQITKEDGTVEPLTEEKAFELLEAILVNVLIARHTAKGVLESKTGKVKEGAPPKTETTAPKTPATDEAASPPAPTAPAPKAAPPPAAKTPPPEAKTPEAKSTAPKTPPPEAKTPEAKSTAPKTPSPEAELPPKSLKQLLREKGLKEPDVEAYLERAKSPGGTNARALRRFLANTTPAETRKLLEFLERHDLPFTAELEEFIRSAPNLDTAALRLEKTLDDAATVGATREAAATEDVPLRSRSASIEDAIKGSEHHALQAAARRASGKWDLVDETLVGKDGKPISIPKKYDKAGNPAPGTEYKTAKPDAVSFTRQEILDDKPLGNPLNYRDQMIGYIRAYEALTGVRPARIIIQWYDPLTLKLLNPSIYPTTFFSP